MHYIRSVIKATQNAINVSKVAVVGAGSAGVAAAKYLLAEKSFDQIRVFEKRATLGGMWNYSKPVDSFQSSISEQQDHFVTPVYDELESNIPHTLMQHSDLAFPPGTQLFPTHSSVLEYLHRYGQDVESLISFDTQVIKIEPALSDKWSITARDLSTDVTSVHQFDAVVVANGHFEVPNVPEIPGLHAWRDKYPGTILHSLSYRAAQPFSGKKVIIVGRGASGSEIATQVQEVCERPILISQTSPPNPELDSLARRILPRIVSLSTDERSVVFANGHIEKHVDNIILCTGYRCEFPFFANLPTLYDGFCTHHLYKHIFYIHAPTLAFIAMPLKSVPFPLAESQSAVIARTWSNRLQLPTQPAMRRWDRAFLSEYGNRKMTPLESAHFNVSNMNELHELCMQARRMVDLEKGGLGKLPPRWGEKEIWVRERIGEIKAAFAAKGNARREISTLEALGFDFEDWKRTSDHATSSL